MNSLFFAYPDTNAVSQNTTDPAAAANRKFHRNTSKKESRKRKNELYL